MPVEILILSGARQGDRLELDENELRVGDTPGCAVFFDPQQNPEIRNRSAVVRREEDGWRIKSLGVGQLWVNQQPVNGPTPIRSGDVVRMSEAGPDFSFTILARKSVPTLPRADKPPKIRTQTGPDIEEIEQSEGPRHSAGTFAAERLEISQITMAVPWVPAAIICALVIFVLLFIVQSFRGKGTESATTSTATPAKIDEGDAASSKQEPEQPPIPTGGNAADIIKAVKPVDASHGPVDKNYRAVIGLCAEEPKGLGLWSLGTGCAIRSDAILTTASVATQLATLRKDGWTIWALSPEQQIREELKKLSVHIGYVKSEQKPENQVFFDLAIVTLSGKLPHVADVAPPADLAKLDAQSKFTCLAILQGEDKEPEPLGRFDRLAPELSRGKVQRILKISDDPGAPRMLLLPPSMPPHIWGSPIFNEQGNLIAVCTEAAQQTATGQVRLNYAPVVDALANWLQERGSDLWVDPVVPERPPEPAKKQ